MHCPMTSASNDVAGGQECPKVALGFALISSYLSFSLKLDEHPYKKTIFVDVTKAMSLGHPKGQPLLLAHLSMFSVSFATRLIKLLPQCSMVAVSICHTRTLSTCFLSASHLRSYDKVPHGPSSGGKWSRSQWLGITLAALGLSSTIHSFLSHAYLRCESVHDPKEFQLLRQM